MNRLILFVATFLAFPQFALGEFILRPFSAAETNQLVTSGSGATGWVGNTLTLASPLAQSWLDPDTETIFIPLDAIGIHFQISTDAIVNGVDVVVAKWEVVPFQSILSDGVHNVSGFSITDWFASVAGVGVPQRIDDIPETTLNGVTTVNFFFANEILAAKAQPNLVDSLLFTRGGPVDNQSAVTITYGNVSWILEGSTGNTRSQADSAVPEPSSLMLLGIGAGLLFGFKLRQRRHSKRPDNEAKLVSED